MRINFVKCLILTPAGHCKYRLWTIFSLLSDVDVDDDNNSVFDTSFDNLSISTLSVVELLSPFCCIWFSIISLISLSRLHIVFVDGNDNREVSVLSHWLSSVSPPFCIRLSLFSIFTSDDDEVVLLYSSSISSLSL